MSNEIESRIQLAKQWLACLEEAKQEMGAFGPMWSLGKVEKRVARAVAGDAYTLVDWPESQSYAGMEDCYQISDPGDMTGFVYAVPLQIYYGG